MNPIGWIEIPVADMSRAVNFYNAIFGWDLKVMDFGQQSMAWFPADPEAYGSGGSLVQHESYVPSEHGAVVYFECEDIAEVVSRVVDAGGEVIQAKKQISPEHGFMGLAKDTEGNRIAFHSQK